MDLRITKMNLKKIKIKNQEAVEAWGGFGNALLALPAFQPLWLSIPSLLAEPVGSKAQGMDGG